MKHPISVDVLDLADFVCRCGRAYFVGGWPQQSCCPCGRGIFALQPGTIWCFSTLATRAMEHLIEHPPPEASYDSAALALVAVKIHPAELEPGELKSAVDASVRWRSIEREDMEDMRLLAHRLRPRLTLVANNA